MIRLIWRHWKCRHFDIEWGVNHPCGYRGGINLGPIAIDLWRI